MLDVKDKVILALALVYCAILGSVGVLDLAAFDHTFVSAGVKLKLIFASALADSVVSKDESISDQAAVYDTLLLRVVESETSHAAAGGSFYSNSKVLRILNIFA